MKKMLVAATAALTMSCPVLAFEVFKDYMPSKEVWNVTFVRVNPNRIDDYLEGLKQTWWTGCEVQKKQGTVLECSIFVSTGTANRDFNVMLVTKSPNAAVTDPDEARYNAFMTEQRKLLDEAKEKQLVTGYEEMRTFFGEQDFRRITFK
jgi:hypothetical protein